MTDLVLDRLETAVDAALEWVLALIALALRLIALWALLGALITTW